MPRRLLPALVAAVLWASPAQGGEWQRLMDGAMQSRQQGNAQSAERKLVAALALAEDFVPDDERLGQILYALALIHYERLEFGVAVGERTLGADHPDLAPILNALALVHTRQGRYGEAETLYQRALAIDEKTLGPRHMDVANLLDFYATAVLMLGREAEAEALLARARAIRGED